MKFLPSCFFLTVAFIYPALLTAQVQNIDAEVDEQYINWYNKDLDSNGVAGISTDRAYKELLKDRKSTTVIVAVIDGGVDINDKDLKDHIWTNEKEIPGNGIDDDHNGYIDDVHGWNFLGNSKGVNIQHETLEVTRLYKKYSDRFADKAEKDIPPDEKAEYREYREVSAAYLKALIKAKEDQQLYTRFITAYNESDSIVKAYLKRDTFTLADLKAIRSTDNEVNDAASVLIIFYESDLTKDKLQELKENADSRLAYHLNPDYNPRKDIIGDDPDRLDGLAYGNNNVIGPNPGHGTFVSGIIAAIKDSVAGIEGIAENIKIMPIRAIPDGDERDKDVANAIRYAVDNGAQIINMSFGKSYSPQKKMVDDAVLYAQSKGVLLVLAAGNDGEDIDKVPDFPTPHTLISGTVNNWITVGAVSMNADKNFVASFSNYGRKNVHLFAPGVDIYGLKPHNRYELGDGTSYAAPMVSGAAALLKSYFPQLTAQQLKAMITHSGAQYRKLRVYKPAEEDKKRRRKIKFFKLSSSGSELNVYDAVKETEEMTAKPIK